jgi:methylase of polypeptide subunit release factors
VKPPILIPRYFRRFLDLNLTVRWETAEWCKWLVELIQTRSYKISTILEVMEMWFSSLLILEIGSGSGCIALYFAYHLKAVKVYSFDINPGAIRLANKNKKSLGLKNAKFLCDDLFSGVFILMSIMQAIMRSHL